jgi:GntR family transcriptional regulator/MocR family aminotransferase
MNLVVHGIAPDADGFDVDAARAVCPRPTAVLVQPHSQYPLGARMPPARREQLLRWADDCGAWIIEHEFLGELALDGPSPPPLLAQDRGEGVLLAGSFSTVMYPSLRLAYLVVPERLAPAFAAVRGMLGDHSPVPMQLALARFIDEGHLAAQLRGLRELYLRRRAALVDTLHTRLAHEPGLGARLHVPPAGVNVCLEVPPSRPDATLLPALAARGVAPGALSLHGRELGPLNGLVLGFGSDDEPRIVAAAEAVAQVLSGA